MFGDLVKEIGEICIIQNEDLILKNYILGSIV